MRSEPHPRVPVNLLVWNGARRLAPCLDSILVDLYPHFSVLVVDNASTDDSRRIVEEKYPDVRLLANRKNLGVATEGR